MGAIDRAGDAIADIPRPVLITGAAGGALIGLVILWRRRSEPVTEDIGSNPEPSERNYDQATQMPSWSDGSYSSTVASDYPPQIAVGSGSLSLDDLLSAFGQIQDAALSSIGAGGLQNSPTPAAESHTAPAATPQQPAAGPAPVVAPPVIFGTASAPVPPPAGFPTWGAVSAGASASRPPKEIDRPYGIKYPFKSDRGWYRVVLKGKERWHYYGPNDNPKIRVN